jgi:hypothetical protein
VGTCRRCARQRNEQDRKRSAEQTSLVVAKILIGGRKTAERYLPVAQTWKWGTANAPEGNPNTRRGTGSTRSARTEFQAPKMKSEENQSGARATKKSRSKRRSRAKNNIAANTRRSKDLGDAKLENRQCLSGREGNRRTHDNKKSLTADLKNLRS